MGNAHLPWAFSAAAGFFLRAHPAAQQFLARFEKKHSQGQALTILAHQLARAVSDMFKRQTALDLSPFLQGAGRGAGELEASRDSHGMHLLCNARHAVKPGLFERS